MSWSHLLAIPSRWLWAIRSSVTVETRSTVRTALAIGCRTGCLYWLHISTWVSLPGDIIRLLALMLSKAFVVWPPGREVPKSWRKEWRGPSEGSFPHKTVAWSVAYLREELFRWWPSYTLTWPRLPPSETTVGLWSLLLILLDLFTSLLGLFSEHFITPELSLLPLFLILSLMLSLRFWKVTTSSQCYFDLAFLRRITPTPSVPGYFG